VAEAAVAGEPDPRWGETGVAYLVRRSGTAPDAQDILEHCGVRLARYKVPTRVEFVDTLPRTSLHKVARSRLRSAGNLHPATPNRQDTA